MNKNPYSLVFGIEPTEYISRISQQNDIVESLRNSSQRVYMVTGVRGAGKTVFMNEIKNYFAKQKDWEVVELSTERDMLNGLASKLSSKDKLSDIFKSAKINLSFLGFGVEIQGTNPIVDIEIALQKMLEALKKAKKNLLVVVDEVVDNKEMREFASVFQILLREKLPVNLLMTGLYENIDDLQNEKNLTFLHRAPKVSLNPLSLGTIAENYRVNLNVDIQEAIKMAQLTKGYSYAFQVLGYLAWSYKDDMDKTRILFKQYLEEYVYDKIWSELSMKDRRVLFAIAQVPSGKILDIRNILEMKPNEFTPYKKRLIRKGIIYDEQGYAIFALPLFDEFVNENYIDE